MLVKGLTEGNSKNGKPADYIILDWDIDYPKDPTRREHIRDTFGNFFLKLCNNGNVSVWLGDECPHCMIPMKGGKCINPDCKGRRS